MISSENVSISLALLAYNEGENIAGVLDASAGSLNKICDSWEIVVVDNHSSDATPDIVRGYAAKDARIRLIVHNENRLYSGSCATALKECRGKYVAIMDSDGQFVASDLPKFIEKLDAGANLVLGWRKKRNDPFMRIVASYIFNVMGRFYFGFDLHDLNCGIRMFDRRFISVAEIKHRLNMANPELFVRARIAGLNITDVVIEHHERVAGVICHDFKKSWKIFYDVNNYMRALKTELPRRKGLK